MTDHAELIERLRALVDKRVPWTHVSAVSAMSEAATALAAVVAERDAAREALKPFGKLADWWTERLPDDVNFHSAPMSKPEPGDMIFEHAFTLGDLRRARAALAQGGET